MSKIVHYSLYSLAIITVLSVFYYVASFWSNCPPCYGITNSDMLYTSALAHNIIYEKGSFWDWLMPTTPFLFPDILLALIINSFTTNILLTIAIFAGIQLGYFLLISLVLLKQITLNKINFFFILIYLLAILLLSKEIAHQANLELLIAVLQSADHFGSFIMILTCFYFFILYWQKSNSIFWGLFLIFASISFAADVLIGFYLLIPLMITIFLGIISGFIAVNKGFKLLTALMIATVCGYLCYKFLPFYFNRANSLIHYQYRLLDFWLIMKNFYLNSPEIFLLWCSFILFAPISVINSLRQRNQGLTNNFYWLNFTLVWQLIMILVMLPIFIITDTHLHEAKTGVYMGLRHLQPVILTPVFIGLPLLIYKHIRLEKLWRQAPVCLGLLILILLASWNHPPLIIKNFTQYYPPEIACLDDGIKTYHLHNGIGNYWATRPLTIFNKSGSYIVPVNSDLSPSVLAGTIQYYKKNNFDFIVSKSPLASFDKDSLIKNLGIPKATFSCPNNYEFLVYPSLKTEILFKNLHHPCNNFQCT